MKLDLDPIKAKILNETKENRENIRDIYMNYCTLQVAKRKRYMLIVGYICLIALVWIFLPVEKLINSYVMLIIIAVIIYRIIFVNYKSIRHYSMEILKEDERLVVLKKAVSEKKDKILGEDSHIHQYLLSLQETTIKAILDDYDYYNGGIYHKNEIIIKRKKLINDIKSSFPKSYSILLFDSSFQKLVFNFSCKTSFNWGDDFIHTKICKVSLYEDNNIVNDEIVFYSYSYFPEYV